MANPQSSALQVHLVTLMPLTIPSGYLMTPRSFLVDRMVADIERIHLPQSQTGGGDIQLKVGHQMFKAPPKKRTLAARTSKLEVFKGPGFIIDFRANSPENWAHFLTNHLTILAITCRSLGQNWSQFTVLLPKGSPRYIKSLVELIGLSALYTDATVEAFGVQVILEKWTVIRGERGTLLRNPDFNPLAAYLERQPTFKTQHKRIFVSRKGNRAIENEHEIEDALTPLGFTKLYAEDLDVGMQIQTILNAEAIVGVHGAALAPILYSTPGINPRALVECFPVGHITDVYRAAAAETGLSWSGVRGYISPSNLKEIYDIGSPYTKHSLNNFRIDSISVRAALKQVDVS